MDAASKGSRMPKYYCDAMRFLLTGGIADWIRLQIVAWGGEITQKYDKKVTHLVVGNNADDELVRNLLFKPVCRISESEIDDFFARVTEPTITTRRITADRIPNRIK